MGVDRDCRQSDPDWVEGEAWLTGLSAAAPVKDVVVQFEQVRG